MQAMSTQENCIKIMKDQARSVIILCFMDKVLRKVTMKKTAASMWKKLESFFYNQFFESKVESETTNLLILNG